MNDREFFTYLEQRGIVLNSQQEQAVKAVKGPTLLLAVPGSGKTTTLIARIGYMVHCCGIDPRSILTLTYTTAATRDMKRRFEELFGQFGTVQGGGSTPASGSFASGSPGPGMNPGGSAVSFRTINSLCNGIINEYARRTGASRFELAEDTGTIIARIYRQVYEDFPTEGDLSEAARVIAYIKNMRLRREEYEALTIGEYKAGKLYEAYVRDMRRHRLMDYDDQLTIALQILVKYPDIRRDYRTRFPYILVDEAQDTSRVQHEIIEVLAGTQPDLFMVGDEDQSIYGFRAAYPQALLDFEKKYEGARVLFLEENYRSTPQIVSAAGRFIRTNQKRKEKHMHTGRPAGAAVRFIDLDSRYGQYAYLMKCLRDVQEDTAVLMRNNDSAIPLIYYLRKNGIPYRSRGMETSFFSHRAVRDIRDFTAFARDSADAEVFMRIYYKTGLKIRREHAVNTVREFDPDRDRGLFHTYLRLYGSKRSGEKIRKVIDEFTALRKDSAWEAIGRIEYHLRKTEERDRERFFILRLLAEHGEQIDAFFAKLEALRQVIAEPSADPDAKVRVSTVHSSKGLEYSQVYIIDAVDGIMPAADAEDIEEERRIFYVAMTRAKDQLNVMCYGDQKMPFVDLLRGKGRSGGPGGSGGTAGSGGSGGLRKTAGSGGPGRGGSGGRTIGAGSRPARDFFSKGDRVRHVTFGKGRVTGLTGDKVIVRFASGRESKILAEYAVEKRILYKEGAE